MTILLDSLNVIQDTIKSIQNQPDSLVLSNHTLRAIAGILKPETSWTDTVQAIAAIFGAIGVVGTLYQLVKRDEFKDDHIAKLTSIADSQEQQIKILSKQVGEITQQTSIMASSLKIYEGILDINGKEFLLKKEASDAKKVEVNERNRIVNLPCLIKHFGSPVNNFYRIVLFNKGKKALKTEVLDLSGNNYIKWYLKVDDTVNIKVKEDLISNNRDFEIETGDYITIDGYVQYTVTHYNPANIPFVLQFNFVDIYGNSYRQRVSRELSGELIVDETPTLEKLNHL